MQDESLRQLENLFLSLSDKTRLRLLGLMGNREVSVGFLADSLGESQPKISRHLAYLRNAGLVQTRRDGKWIYYGIDWPTDRTAANVLNATLGLATQETRAVREGIEPSAAPTYEPVPAHEEFTPYEAEYTGDDEDWRPEELEVFLL